MVQYRQQQIEAVIEIVAVAVAADYVAVPESAVVAFQNQVDYEPNN